MVGDDGVGEGSVTIVVPAYNVERYLPECLGSLRAQTIWDECRVVVVDDGSTDATAEIAAQAGADDPRIRLIRQPNSGPGPGAARNHGLDLVETEFVMFCDGDDELTPYAAERLREGLRRFGLDLAVGPTEQFPEPRRWLWTPYFRPGSLTSVSIETVPLLAHNAATGNKMFRTAALRASRRRFAEGIHHQDTVVTVPSMVTAPRIALVGDVVHRYRKRPEGGSIMDGHYTRTDNFWDHLQVIETLGAELDALPAGRRELQEAFIARSFQGFTWRAPSVLPPDRVEEFFDRTRAVVRRLSPEVIVAATRDAHERSAYVTMLEDDLDAFRDLDRLTTTLRADDGDLYLAVPTTNHERHAMLQTGATRALASGLRLTPDAVEVDLRLRVQGATRVQGSLDAVRVRARPQGRGAPVESDDLQLAPGEGEECAVVRLPRARLGVGTYALRLVFVTPTGETSRWVRRPRVPATGDEVPAHVPSERVVDARTGVVAALHSLQDRAVLELF